MLNIFNFEQERDLARRLAEELVKQLPPRHFTLEKRGTLSVNKVSRTLERLYALAREQNQSWKMGMVRRSILANSFKWHLREASYPADFVNMATEGLLVELLKKN